MKGFERGKQIWKKKMQLEMKELIEGVWWKMQMQWS